jgi:protein-disulfide isomerase
MLPHNENTLSRPALSADHVLGPAAAPVVILEYGCYCSAREIKTYEAVCAVRDVFPEQVAFVFRHYPLVVSYPTAFDAAETAEAAAAQGHFWRMHAYLAEHAHLYTCEELLQIAADLGLDANAVAGDLASHLHRDTVTAHFLSGVRSGVRRVPAIFVNGQPLQEEVTADSLCRMVARAGARALGKPW